MEAEREVPYEEESEVIRQGSNEPHRDSESPVSNTSEREQSHSRCEVDQREPDRVGGERVVEEVDPVHDNEAIEGGESEAPGENLLR